MEAIAAGLRVADDGSLKDFYEGLSERSLWEPLDYEARFGLLRQWQQAYPESSTAAIAQASFAYEFAGQARGGGYADSVAKDAWRVYGKRLETGVKALKRVKDSDSVYYHTAIRYLNATGDSKEQVLKLALECQSRHPKMLRIHSGVANYLLPRWHGKDGELLKAAQQLSKQAPGKGVFTIMVAFNYRFDKEDIFSRDYPSYLPWEQAVEGLTELVKLKQLDPLLAQRFAIVARAKKDKKATQLALQNSGDYPILEVFPDFKEWKAIHDWAR